MRSLLKSLAILAAVFLCGVALLAGSTYIYLTDFSYKRQPFVAESWRAGDSKLRGTMVPDLLDKNILIGRSAAEVTALLGPSDFAQDPYSRGAHYIT